MDYYEKLILIFSFLSYFVQDEIVNVRIPRFEISSSMDLLSSLKKLGLSEIFNKSNLDFSLMAQNENMFLTTVPHK